MFAGRYFTKKYFAESYFPPVIAAPTPPPTPGGETSYGYFAHKYFAAPYYANRYFPGAGFGTALTPEPEEDDELLGGKAAGKKKRRDDNWHDANYSYVTAYQKRKADLEKLTNTLAETELKQQQLEADKREANDNAQLQMLARLEAQAQADISRLRTERVWLMRAIDEEEAILVILLSTPFVN